MSTKGTADGADWTVSVGGEEFHASVHAYTECFDDDRDLYMEFCEQGVFDIFTKTVCIPHTQAVEFAEALGKWAATQREREAAKGDSDVE